MPAALLASGAEMLSKNRVMMSEGIGGAVIHPLVLALDDETLRSQLRKETQKLLPLRA
jgi:hypothetical protein